MQTRTSDFFHTRTRLQAGNDRSDRCYANRNLISIGCAFKGWPQDKKADPLNLGYNPCWGNENEIGLMSCLNRSGETRWWLDFAGCTSPDQCIDRAKHTHKTITGSDY